MKITVIGCTHAGTAAIEKAAILYPEAEITVYERNDNISFLSCGIALYVGGYIKETKGLFYNSPEKLKGLGVVTKMNHLVIGVNLSAKSLKIKNLKNNSIIENHFDKLIISTGSWPVKPPIEGIDLDNILLCKNYEHSNRIIEQSKNAQNIIVVGAGYIGVELVEAFEKNGKNVTLIDGEKRILSKYLDKEFTDLAQDKLAKNGISLLLDEKVVSFSGEEGKVQFINTEKDTYKADMVVLAMGFKANTELFKGQLDRLDDGAIVVDKYMQTSYANVFAAGDCCSVLYNPTGKAKYIPLATNAVKMGAIVAQNLMKPTVAHMGTQGTSGIKIYDLNIASTGLTEESALNEGFKTESTILEENNKPEFMKDHQKLKIILVHEKISGRILGAQLISKIDLTQSINTMSICIQNRMTISQLAYSDFFFQPHYNKPWNFLNQAAMDALSS